MKNNRRNGMNAVAYGLKQAFFHIYLCYNEHIIRNNMDFHTSDPLKMLGGRRMLVHGSIAINQLGYRPQDYKLAVISGKQGSYRIIQLPSKKVVWQGASSPAVWDEASGQEVCKLNFSSLVEEGEFQIEDALKGSSSMPFVIAKDVYDEVQLAVLKVFYFLRCGMPLEESFAGQWKHASCHRSLVHVYGQTEQQFDGSGGWHDAGDYGRYIVAAGKAVADMLLAFEFFSHAFARKVPLPESDERMPDLLWEVKYELDWMLKMQEPSTGGVYHKLTTLQFPSLHTMPEDDHGTLYAMPISATATGSFAAALAMAARIYAPYDEQFAAQCLKAARLAYSWLETNPEVEGFRNPADVGTGEYGDGEDGDERYWAAAELYRTTGEARYHQAFLRHLKDGNFSKTGLGWRHMGGYGTLSYLLNEHEQDEQAATLLKQHWSERAEQLVAVCQKDGYGISLLPEEYEWGSNMDVLNNGMLLIIDQLMNKHHRYDQYISQHIHYLFGTNVNQISYVSGYGARAMSNPHYRPTVAGDVNATVPGMVAGGPNRHLQDEYAQVHLQGRASAACYADHEESYSTNEITIYWNSPALFVLSYFTSSAT